MNEAHRKLVSSTSSEQRACPLCGALEAGLLTQQSFEELPGRSLVDGYAVMCCGICGFAFASGLPGPEDFARYYTDMSKYEHSATSGFTSPEDQRRCESIVDLVDAHVIDRSLAVLDVGCSTGALLAAFKCRGYANVEGLDPSPACAVSARQAHDIIVRTGVAGDLANLPRRYGLLLLSAVLEHLLDPLQVLRDARNVLSGDGLLFIEVPDVEGFVACARAPFQEFSVEHINYFSRASLISLAGVSGFECVQAHQKKVPWTSGTQSPVIHGVFRKARNVVPPLKDDVTQAVLLTYVAESVRIEDSVRARVAKLADCGRPVLVWGVGTHTRHLLKTGTFDGLLIAAYVDSDPKYQGTEIRGVPVLAPAEVAARHETILISSGTLHHEIVRQIREGGLGVCNEIVSLYE